MKQLNRKTFWVILTIFTIFIMLGIIIFNIQNYKKEYENIDRNLNFMVNDKPKFKDNIIEHKDNQEPPELKNMYILDYEVYTVTLNNNKIKDVISHSKDLNNIDIEKISKDILNKNNKDITKIGNLYTSEYSYNLKINKFIVILNNKSIKSRLNILLIKSILLFIILEVLVYFISKIITRWITKPAIDSYNKQKDFIADASHELKTPLAIIMASSDELSLDKKNSKYIDNIRYETDRMSNLISKLLDLSKIENGILKSTYKDENISKIIEKICLTFDAVAYEKNIKIDTSIESDIIYKCSKEEIEKLISILIDNAIKHSYKDSIINVVVLKEKNYINIEVINKGNPINKGEEEKIFERFYRSDKSRNRSDNRYGLGLAIAKSIVLNYNGNIKAYSIDDKTTFKINLKK